MIRLIIGNSNRDFPGFLESFQANARIAPRLGNDSYLTKKERNCSLDRTWCVERTNGYGMSATDTTRWQYSQAPHNDVSVNNGPHIRRWSHKII